MDGFFPFSEEPARGPTPPHESSPAAGGKGGANGLRVDVKAWSRAAGQGGGHAAITEHVSTPNASLAGKRAKMR